jgi:hypothetical protein
MSNHHHAKESVPLAFRERSTDALPGRMRLLDRAAVSAVKLGCDVAARAPSAARKVEPQLRLVTVQQQIGEQGFGPGGVERRKRLPPRRRSMGPSSHTRSACTAQACRVLPVLPG